MTENNREISVMRCANFDIVENRFPGPLIIRDVGPWAKFPTITNDVKGVVARLIGSNILKEHQRLLYYDSENILDEIIVKDDKFVRFQNITMENIGESEITDFDDANVPVNIFIEKEDETDTYLLTIDNFMPRKGCVNEGFVQIRGTKTKLHELVKIHILPHYKRALELVTKVAEGNADSFYYWK